MGKKKVFFICPKFQKAPLGRVSQSVPRSTTAALWCSRGAECDADPLSDPAGGEEFLSEGTVEGVQPRLAVAIVGECPGLVVQQHAYAAVLRGARQRLPPAVVPGAELVLVQLQAPRQLVHPHHAPLALLLPGDGFVGDLQSGNKGEVSKKRELLFPAHLGLKTEEV